MDETQVQFTQQIDKVRSHESVLSDSINPLPNLSEALISISNLRINAREVKRHIGSKCEVMAIVKANAYGHNVDGVAPALVEEGITNFGVANINEAIHLRDVISKSKANILAFASPLPNQLESYAKYDIELSISHIESVRQAEAIARKLGKKLTAHLKIDTGMGRLGASVSDATEIANEIRRSEHLNLKAIYTHFASSGDDKAFTKKQLSIYRNLVSEFEHQHHITVLKHAANSGAVISDSSTHLDMVRPGILLYGYPPHRKLKSSLNLKPVMQLQSHVIFTKWIEKGTTISYGRKWTAKKRTRIATISIGYADGYSRALTNQSKVLIRQKEFSQVGAVTMDIIMVDLGLDESVQVGDDVVLFGWNEKLNANTLAEKANTIGYELLCAVSPRVKRVFVE